MKNIYTNLLTRLSTAVPTLAFIDLDKGQLLMGDPVTGRLPIPSPSALLSIQFPRTEARNMGRTKQDVDVLITVRLVWDYTGNTSSITPDTARNQSLAYLDLMEEVYAALQGWQPTDKSMNPLNRTSLREDPAPRGHKVMAMPFTSQYRET